MEPSERVTAALATGGNLCELPWVQSELLAAARRLLAAAEARLAVSA